MGFGKVLATRGRAYAEGRDYMGTHVGQAVYGSEFVFQPRYVVNDTTDLSCLTEVCRVLMDHLQFVHSSSPVARGLRLGAVVSIENRAYPMQVRCDISSYEEDIMLGWEEDDTFFLWAFHPPTRELEFEVHDVNNVTHFVRVLFRRQRKERDGNSG